MNVNIEELITINYELEGLLYLALHRGEDTPVQVWAMISDKIDALREGVKMPDEQEETTLSPVTDDIDKISDEPVIESEEPSTEAVVEEPDIPAETEEETEPEAAEETVIETEPEAPVMETDIETETDAAIADTPVIAPEQEEEEIVSTDTDDITEIDDEKTSEVIEEVPVENEPIRLDEKLARQYSKDLRKAFSLNDRFRFRRELFGNSDAEMNDTLNLVEAMINREEAYDYFYHDLQWDRDNQEVIDFMAIIEKHFSNK